MSQRVEIGVDAQLWQAAHDGQVLLVLELLARGASPNALGSSGLVDALAIAVRRRHEDVAVALLDAGATLPAGPLTRLAVNGAINTFAPDVVARFLDRVDDVNAHAPGQATWLHFAAGRSDPRIAAMLIDRGAEVAAVARVVRNEAPLHRAAASGHVAVAMLLVDAGAPIDPQDVDGLTPLTLADMNDHAAVVELLLAHGADPAARLRHRRTLLHRAAARGTVDEVRHALHTCDVNDRDLWGDTALHVVARCDRVAIVRVLLAAGADTTIRNRAKETALDLAANDQFGSHLATVKLLADNA